VEFLPQMVVPPRVTTEQIVDGLRLFVVGLFKKLFIADQLHQLFVEPVFANPGVYSPAVLRWASIAWAVQIYCDFSGYTDIALGTAKWFGFELPANFRLPYLATSITDFWRRWHLSLSTWLRDYLYFPMGGSKLGEWRTNLNLIVLFVLCGLWHGATWSWLAYGLFNGVFMCGHRAFDRYYHAAGWRKHPAWVVLAWLATMYQLLLGLVLIRMIDWPTGMHFLAAWFGIAWQGTVQAPAAFQGVPVLVFPLLLLGLAGHLVYLRPQWAMRWQQYEAIRSVGYALGVLLLVTIGPGVSKSFIYIAF
jgi:alginate O-acetyltransferase complex protein AlgI